MESSKIKKPQFISPSALETWLSSPEEYFLKYMAVDKVPRIPQTQPMSVGSAFDAYIKTYVSKFFYGTDSMDVQTELERQVDPHNRDFAIKAGAVCYQAYRKSGALAKLMEDLKRSPTQPRMEFTAMGSSAEHGGIYNTVKMTEKAEFILRTEGTITTEQSSVVVLGKPDLSFQTTTGVEVVDDWKVNGYCARTPKRPTPGYLWLWDGFEPESKNHGRAHRDAIPFEEGEYQYSLHPNIEMQDEKWARQITVYSWLVGCPVGSEILVGIDQLCCSPSLPAPRISVAQHRCTITEAFQLETYRLFQRLWNNIHSDHFFTDLTKEQSQERCEILLKQAAMYNQDNPHADYLNKLRTGFKS